MVGGGGRRVRQTPFQSGDLEQTLLVVIVGPFLFHQPAGLFALEVLAFLLERFGLACADLKPGKRFVVYSGNERFPLDADTDAIGLIDLGQALQAIK